MPRGGETRNLSQSYISQHSRQFSDLHYQAEYRVTDLLGAANDLAIIEDDPPIGTRNQYCNTNIPIKPAIAAAKYSADRRLPGVAPGKSWSYVEQPGPNREVISLFESKQVVHYGGISIPNQSKYAKDKGTSKIGGFYGVLHCHIYFTTPRSEMLCSESGDVLNKIWMCYSIWLSSYGTHIPSSAPLADKWNVLCSSWYWSCTPNLHLVSLIGTSRNFDGVSKFRGRHACGSRSHLLYI